MIFKSKLTTDDSLEEQSIRDQQDVMHRNRISEMEHLDANMRAVKISVDIANQEKRKNARLRDQLENSESETDIERARLAKERSDHDITKKELEKLQKEREIIKSIAVQVAVDRRAILDTINYLSKKWGSPVHEKSEEFEAERKKNNEKYSDEKSIDRVSNQIEKKINNKLKTNSKLKR